MTDNRNVIIAIVLSMVVLFGWQFFVAAPQLERAQQQAQIAAEQAQSEAALATPAATVSADGTTAPAADGSAVYVDRASAIAATQRVTIDTADLHGSINLTGARLDDLELKQYRETVNPDSPIITLLTPAGAPGAYFAEQGWVPATGASIAVPNGQTVWSVEGDA
ncbi:MAG: membrane protein insertase YidC, partial [Ferrovibrio sp.]